MSENNTTAKKSTVIRIEENENITLENVQADCTFKVSFATGQTITDDDGKESREMHSQMITQTISFDGVPLKSIINAACGHLVVGLQKIRELKDANAIAELDGATIPFADIGAVQDTAEKRFKRIEKLYVGAGMTVPSSLREKFLANPVEIERRIVMLLGDLENI